MAKVAGKSSTVIEVRVELKPEVMDAEALSAKRALDLLGITDLAEVRLSRTYELTFTGIRPSVALSRAKESVERLLANPVIHDVSVKEKKRR